MFMISAASPGNILTSGYLAQGAAKQKGHVIFVSRGLGYLPQYGLF